MDISEQLKKVIAGTLCGALMLCAGGLQAAGIEVAEISAARPATPVIPGSISLPAFRLSSFDDIPRMSAPPMISAGIPSVAVSPQAVLPAAAQAALPPALPDARVELEPNSPRAAAAMLKGPAALAAESKRVSAMEEAPAFKRALNTKTATAGLTELFDKGERSGDGPVAEVVDHAPEASPRLLAAPRTSRRPVFAGMLPALFAVKTPLLAASLPLLNGEIGSDILKIGLAVALGGAIGLERELNDKGAGLRTNILVCLGACIFMIVSRSFMGDPNADPTRIAAQIVSGVGFLGGGAILHRGNRLSGITTAAVIWAVASIGMALGDSHYALALLGTGTALMVLTLFSKIDREIVKRHEKRVFKISIKDEKALDGLEAMFQKAGVRIWKKELSKTTDRITIEWSTVGPHTAQEAAMKALVGSPDVLEVAN